MNDVSEENLPSKEQCQKVVDEFVSITGTDGALAQFFLQDREWNLERSLNAYYEAKTTGGVNVLNDGSETDVVVTFDSGMTSMLENLNANITTTPPDKFSLMTWNLDGLDHLNLKKRTKAVAKIIELEKPDIIFLQEVIPATYTYLEEHLPGYMLIAGGTEDYFTATLLYRLTVYFDGHTIHTFPNTLMQRNLLQVDCHIGSLNLRLLNSHLESTAEFSEQRKIQLKQCFNLLNAKSKKQCGIFGGDLNVRDKEVVEVRLQNGVKDLWEACGRRKECEFTWDTLRNTNKSFPGKFKPRTRFDRLYLQDGVPASVEPTYFGLTGIQKVSGLQCFPSDHWGIVVNFKILNQQAKTSSPSPSYNANKTPQPREDLGGPSCSFVSKDDSVIDLSDNDDCRLDGQTNDESVIELD